VAFAASAEGNSPLGPAVFAAAGTPVGATVVPGVIPGAAVPGVEVVIAPAGGTPEKSPVLGVVVAAPGAPAGEVAGKPPGALGFPGKRLEPAGFVVPVAGIAAPGVVGAARGLVIAAPAGAREFGVVPAGAAGVTAGLLVGNPVGA